MKKLIEKIKSLDKGTIIRTILFICAIGNQIVAVIGMSSFASEFWYQILSVVFTAIITIITAWKNNNFTYFAQLTGAVLTALKDGKITKEEVLELLQKASKEEGDSKEVVSNE